MVFSSIEFLLFFLPLFLLAYALTPDKMKNMTLLSGSLVFYALGEPRSLLILMISVVVNYFISLHLGRRERLKGKNKKRNKRLERRRRLLLITAIMLNLMPLAFFKGGLGESALPLGISFYTFQILSYLIDLYRSGRKGEPSFVVFATYITMFPRLLSGPIVYYSEVETALHRRKFTVPGVQEGLKVFTMGLAAKVMLADRIGLLWQEVQVTGFESISTPLAWLAAVAYSLKIYFDFYGYSLMARGLGKMLGFELPENFRTPYMAGSVREFYRRWHITLGRWFCNYVYIPLGGNRSGEFRTVCNLLAVWFLTAIWHGGTANFLIWGMLLWLAIVLERQLNRLGVWKYLEKGPGKLLASLYLWAFIPVTWICFAVTEINQLQIFLGRMFHVVDGIRVSAGDWLKALTNYGWLFAVGGFACTAAVQKLFRRFKDTLPGMVFLVLLFWWCVWRLQREGQNPFMYRDF